LAGRKAKEIQKGITSKPFMFAQNVSVPECKSKLSRDVHRVIPSSH